MRKAGHEPRPGVLLTQFNSRFRGRSISFQTASRWLGAKSVPTPDKLAVLADWLQLDRGYLGFGEKPSRQLPNSQVDRQIKEERAAYEEHELVDAFRALSAEHRRLVREVIVALAQGKRG